MKTSAANKTKNSRVNVSNQDGTSAETISKPVAATETGQLDNTEQLTLALEKHWGYQSFRPLQLNAMTAAMEDRDSLVIFPTGGGKSLCFQAPAVCKSGIAVVVSPLISLMKDQVDALNANGVRAAVLNSSLSPQAESEVLKQIRTGDLQMVYLAPERLLTERTFELLRDVKVSLFAIDEAHCVSEWGHDFRPEYRGLSVLKQKFPNVAIHAYTATATEQVRHDIVRQLGLAKPEILIGSMDRPNLNYQLRRRVAGMGQILDVLKRHADCSGIIYCLSKKQVDSTAASLNALGYKALPYHAGMSSLDRKKSQDAFLTEEVNIIVATVAFGMGIDKSNVRFVIHATMPKSLEAYQQESGRAGRDGLDAECWLLHNGSDIMSWKRMIDENESPQGRAAAQAALNGIANFCSSLQCRHVSLAAHFGEQLTTKDCGACDVCLGEGNNVSVDDPKILGQKIVSGVFRVDQRFGADYVAQVLLGSRDQRILNNGHDQVSTYGLLASETKQAIRMWIDQLVAQDFLLKEPEFGVLKITDLGNQLLRGQAIPKLTKPAKVFSQQSSGSGSASPSARAATKEVSWEGIDKPLFEKLRTLREQTAKAKELATHVVFSDHSLREMARLRPSTEAGFRLVMGVSAQKLTDFGPEFLATINRHCQSANVKQDIADPVKRVYQSTASPNSSAIGAFPFFDEGLSVAEVAKKIGRAESTTHGYLQSYIEYHGVSDASRWVDAATIAKVTAAAEQVGAGALKPVFVALDEKVPYDQIRIVLACLASAAPSS